MVYSAMFCVVGINVITNLQLRKLRYRWSYVTCSKGQKQVQTHLCQYLTILVFCPMFQ